MKIKQIKQSKDLAINPWDKAGIVYQGLSKTVIDESQTLAQK